MTKSEDTNVHLVANGGSAATEDGLELCPKCGNEEWDHVTAERGRERDVPFNHCPQCDHEWNT